MFIEQIVEFELRRLGPPGRIILKLVIFRTKQKSLMKIYLRVNYDLLPNILQKAMVPCFLYWTMSITKFIQKMLDFKRELSFKRELAKGGLKILIFSINSQLQKI